MNRPITIIISGDEAAIILDALDTECEIYRQSTYDATADGNRDLAIALGAAADRICACRVRLARAIDAAPPRT